MVIVTAVKLILREQREIGEPRKIVMTCTVDETDVGSVLVMQIKAVLEQQKVQLGVLQAEKGLNSTIPANLADRMTVDGSIDNKIPTNSKIVLTVDSKKMECADPTSYWCHLTYLDNNISNPSAKSHSDNGTLGNQGFLEATKLCTETSGSKLSADSTEILVVIALFICLYQVWFLC